MICHQHRHWHFTLREQKILYFALFAIRRVTWLGTFLKLNGINAERLLVKVGLHFLYATRYKLWCK